MTLVVFYISADLLSWMTSVICFWCVLCLFCVFVPLFLDVIYSPVISTQQEAVGYRSPGKGDRRVENISSRAVSTLVVDIRS